MDIEALRAHVLKNGPKVPGQPKDSLSAPPSVSPKSILEEALANRERVINEGTEAISKEDEETLRKIARGSFNSDVFDALTKKGR